METAQRVAQAINLGLGFGALLAAYFFLSHRSEDGGATRLQKWVDYIIMSREQRNVPVREEIEPVRGGGSGGSDDPVLPHQNQVEPVEPAVIEPGREPLVLHNLSHAALIALLSVQKNDSNGWRFSKNQIAAFVGGTKAEILKEIDLYRGPPPSAPKPATRVDRPIGGWNKA